MMKLFTGGESYPIKNGDGTYNDEFIEIINLLISEQGVTIDIATTILKEIEDTGQPTTLEELRLAPIWNSLLLQKYPL